MIAHQPHKVTKSPMPGTTPLAKLIGDTANAKFVHDRLAEIRSSLGPGDLNAEGVRLMADAEASLWRFRFCGNKLKIGTVNFSAVAPLCTHWRTQLRVAGGGGDDEFSFQDVSRSRPFHCHAHRCDRQSMHAESLCLARP